MDRVSRIVSKIDSFTKRLAKRCGLDDPPTQEQIDRLNEKFDEKFKLIFWWIGIIFFSTFALIGLGCVLIGIIQSYQ